MREGNSDSKGVLSCPVVGNHKETSVRMENVKFECKLETVDRGQVVVSLFKGSGEQLQEGANDEFLMHLSAEVPDQGEEKVQEAEFIVVVDR